MVDFSTSREQAMSGRAPSAPDRNLVYNMDIRQPTHGRENVHGVAPSFERDKREWLRNEPLNVDYGQLEADTLANRQRVGWVPQTDLRGKKTYIPASRANLQGYFNDPNAPGKSYFETNPEFKTFFPNDPYYAGLASLKHWQETGQGIYNESDAMGSGYFGSYKPSTQTISMNLGEDLDETLKEYYGNNYQDTERGYRDTLLHEMMHHWERAPYEEGGPNIRKSFKTLSQPGHSDVITEGENVWNPEREISANDSYWGAGTLTMDEVQDFMGLHRLGKRQYQGNNFNAGGIAGLPGQWTPSMSESEEEEYNIRPFQLDPGIMSIEDLEALFEEAGLDKSIIYKLINSGGLSQLIS